MLGLEPASLQVTQLRPGRAAAHTRKERSSRWVPWNTKGSSASGPWSQEGCSSGCDPANEPDAQEDPKARQRLQLFLEIHGTETHPRGGFPKAAEGPLCSEGLPHPESE